MKATVTTFGTMVPCGKAPQDMYCVVTITQGKGHYVKVKCIYKKVTLTVFSETFKIAVTTFKIAVTKFGTLEHTLCSDLHPRSRSWPTFDTIKQYQCYIITVVDPQ